MLFSIIDDITERKRTEDKLKQSEIALKKAEEIGKFGYWQLHLNEKLMISSDGASIIYGFDTNENILAQVQRMAHEEYRPMLDKALYNLIHQGLIYDVEYKIKRESDGKIIDIHSKAEFDAAKNIIFGTVQDISEQKHLEETLKLNEHFMKTIMDNLPGMVAYWNSELQNSFANEAYLSFFGKTKEQMQGISMLELMKSELFAQNKPFVQRVLAGNKQSFERTLIKQNGTTSYTWAQYIPDFDGEKVKGFFAIVTDITEIKNAQIELEQLNQQLQLRSIEIGSINNNLTKERDLIQKYLNLVEVLILSFNTDGSIQMVNRKGLEILGYEKDELQNKNWFKTCLPQPQGMEQIFPIYKEILAGNIESFEHFENEIITKTGEKRLIAWHNNYLRNENGVIEASISSGEDITDRKQAELKIQQQNMELIKLNTDKDRFISILAHDLKSPFGSLVGFSELLLANIRKYDISKIEKHLTNIYNSAQNIYSLLDDLLMWARSQSGHLQFEPNEYNFAKLNADIIQVLTPTANAKKITINQFADSDIIVYADIDMLKTVLRNLISNAIKYTNCEGTIDITANKSPSEITISVSDNGVGIAPQNLSKLFDMAQKHTTSGTSGEKGTGLGILLCKEFVEKHGGRIWVESELGQGSTFKFTLPYIKI